MLSEYAVTSFGNFVAEILLNLCATYITDSQVL
jgi:hypothetical protein